MTDDERREFDEMRTAEIKRAAPVPPESEPIPDLETMNNSGWEEEYPPHASPISEDLGKLLAKYRNAAVEEQRCLRAYGADSLSFIAAQDEFSAARSAIEALFGKLEAEAKRLRAEIEKGYSDIYKTQLRYRESAREATKRYGFEEGELQWLWRNSGCFTRKYDIGEVVAAICDALTREGCTAWPGDGTSCVEQMIRLQWDRAQAAEAELARISSSGNET
jgi:hypothetical protein